MTKLRYLLSSRNCLLFLQQKGFSFFVPNQCQFHLCIVGSSFQSSSISLHRHTMGQHDKLFVGEEQTKMYADFRPRYPQQMYETIVRSYQQCESADSVKKSALAVDIGCGPGVSTIPLVKYFQKVIGVDVSQQQIDNAPKDNPDVSFFVSSAEDLPFIEDRSVDLVTIAQALHWLDLDKFYSEINRILKPGGFVVAYGYSFLHVNIKEMHDYLMDIHTIRLAEAWSPNRAHVDNCYKNLPAPYNNGIWISNDDHSIEKDMTVDAIVGYLSSWSSITAYNKTNPNTDILAEIRHRLLAILQRIGKGEKDTVCISWPVFIRMSRKPEDS